MPRIRVLVVDDSVVARKIVADALAGDPEIEVIGTAANGRIALAMVEHLVPDLLTMDLEMPLMDGIETVRALRRRGDRLPIVVFTSASAQVAKATFNALAAGATDFVTKPSGMISADGSLDEVAKQLIPRVRALVPHGGARPAVSGTVKAAPLGGRSAAAIRPAAPRERTGRPVQAVVIGASIGGPEALSRVLRRTPRLAVPMVLVQHMPPVFARQFAARLDSLCASTILEASGGEDLQPGHVYVAPGDFHLELRATVQGAQTLLHQGPLVNFSRPSVDVLFHFASRVFGADLLAVVLTGMGSDGCGAASRWSRRAALCWCRTRSRASSGACLERWPRLALPTRCCPSMMSALRSSRQSSVHDPLAGPPQGVPSDALRMHSWTWPTSCVGAVPLRAARDAARLARTPARHLGVDDLTTRSGPTPFHHGHDKLQQCPR